MLIIILEAIEKIVGLITARTSLLQTTRRKELGHSLVQLHQIVSRLADNAAVLELTAERIARKASPETWRLIEFQTLIETQRHELRNLQVLLDANRAFLDIYGDEWSPQLKQLWGPKTLMLEDIADRMLNTDGGRIVVIPRIAHLGTDSQPSGPTADNHYLFWCDVSDDKLATRFPVSDGLNFVSQEARSAIGVFAEQAISLQISVRLRACASSLADLLKTQFKLEELF